MEKREMNGVTRKITAATFDEARKKLYDAHGFDYTIVDKKTKLVGGFFGIGQKEFIELEYKVKPRGESSVSSETFNPHSQQKPLPAAFLNNYSDFMKNKEEILRKNTVEVPASNLQLKKIEQQLAALNEKLDESSKNIHSENTNPVVDKIEHMLEENDFSASFIKMINKKIHQNFSLDELNDFEFVQRRVVDWVGESILIEEAKPLKTPYVAIIVGPTGVGKTTTLVKLAAQYVLAANVSENRKVKICFVCTDIMRVGAYEQLKKFADTFKAPTLQAHNAQDLKKIYEDYKDDIDAFFIDTSGYSPNDATHIAQMKETLAVHGLNPEIYLAFVASTKATDIKNILQNYEPLGYNSVIVTKCDESTYFGNVISVLNDRHKSIAYVTDGQKVAKDILKPDIAFFLTALDGFKIDRVHIEDRFADKAVGE